MNIDKALLWLTKNKYDMKCVLCKKEVKGYGNNPSPLSEKGSCCDECNITKVIPARLAKWRPHLK